MLSNRGFDLLRFEPLRTVLLWRGLPATLQALALGAIILEPEIFVAFLPAIVVVTVLFGRIWCAACPLEAIGAIVERIALPNRDAPRWAASGFLGVALFGVVLVRPPTPKFFIALAAGAVFVSVIFRGRVFCRALCPANELLATYGRGGMLAVRPELRTIAASCPGGLEPSMLTDNRDCRYCMSCVRQGGMRVLLRWPFASDDVRRAFSSWPAAIFVMLTTAILLWRRTGNARLALALWPALAVVAWLCRGAATPWQALRRIALPASVILIAVQLGGFLPWPAAIALVAASALLAGWEGRLVRFRGAAVMGLPLLLLAAAFVYAFTRPAVPKFLATHHELSKPAAAPRAGSYGR
jgi:hypothetical protein